MKDLRKSDGGLEGIWQNAQSVEKVVVIRTLIEGVARILTSVCVGVRAWFEDGKGQSNKRSEVKWERTNESALRLRFPSVGRKVGLT